MNKVIVSVGSNIDPKKNIDSSKYHIQKKHRILKMSNFEYTKPVGFKDQADFLNGAYLIMTEMDRENFKKDLKAIEVNLGRSWTINKNGPRTIDLDIIVWNNDIVDDEFYERDFVNKFVKELL